MNKYSSKFSFRQSCLVTTYLLVTTSEPPTQQDTITDLFIFLLRYSFMQNDATKSQNSCASKTTQLNATQGNIYMGTRYLDPKYSRWISNAPALGEYIPAAGKGNSENAGNLPGMGGIYNHINGDLYHYAGNNPVHYIDPDGRKTESGEVQALIDNIGNGANLYVPLEIIDRFSKRGWKYIGNDNLTVQELNTELKEFANDNDEMMVSSLHSSKTVTETQVIEKSASEQFKNVKKMYLKNAIGVNPSQIAERDSGDKNTIAKNTEYILQVYLVSIINPDTDKPGLIFKSYVDVNNDGNIDFFTWGHKGGYNED